MSIPSPSKPPIIRPAETATDEVSLYPGATDRSFLAQSALHWVFLGLSTFVMIAAVTMQVRNGREVIVPIINKALPGACTFLRITGVPCPGCGMTRSFISLAHGQWSEAWAYNPAGLMFFWVVAFQIPYRVFQIVRIGRGHGEHSFVAFDKWILLVLVALLIMQWAARIAWQWIA